MNDKIKILFEELGKKYPDIMDEEFVGKITSVIENGNKAEVDSEVEDKLDKAKKAAVEEYKASIKKNDDEDENDDKKKKEDDDDDDEEVKESIAKIIDTLDVFCEEACLEFCAEHAEKIEESIKTNTSFDIVENLKSILEGHGMKVDGSELSEQVNQSNVIAGLNRTIASLTEKIANYENSDIKTNALSIVEKVTSKMTESQKEKFIKLIEDYDINNLSVFEGKVNELDELLRFRTDNNKIVGEEEIKKSDIILDSEEINENEKIHKPNEGFMNIVSNTLRKNMKK